MIYLKFLSISWLHHAQEQVSTRPVEFSVPPLKQKLNLSQCHLCLMAIVSRTKIRHIPLENPWNLSPAEHGNHLLLVVGYSKVVGGRHKKWKNSLINKPNLTEFNGKRKKNKPTECNFYETTLDGFLYSLCVWQKCGCVIKCGSFVPHIENDCQARHAAPTPNNND